MTLGSLFDGIAAFPLAATRHGITPVWASEIDPAPASISARHFPEMIQLGDITKIGGAAIEPVDIITFGSPCQDLSIAGKRAGLEGERSGLFLEAIRIIKEMRDATGGIKPRYCVWENVPGAFSSNKGDDFRTVVEQIIGIVPSRCRREGIPVPRPPGGGRWPVSGAVMGDGYSLAWRTLDAKYWGVPQRRRRIFLVADFGGGRAGEILFKPEGVHGRSAQGGETGEGTAAGFEGSPRKAGGTDYLTGWDAQEKRIFSDRGVSPTLSGSDGGGGRNLAGFVWPVCARFMAGQGAKAGGMAYGEEVAPTLKAEASGTNQVPTVIVLNDQGGERMGVEKSDVSPTLRAETHGHPPLVAAFTPSSFGGYAEGVGTLRADGGDLGGGSETLVRNAATVRKLTPTECERLQGLPDGWTAYGAGGKAISDSARYKALGNSVAVPCVEFIMAGITGAANA